jgi:hypothetical protein
MELHFDFTEAATRSAILDQIKANLSDMAWESLCVTVKESDLAQEHYHDLEEVFGAIDELVYTAKQEEDMRGVYTLLAEAEAAAHGCSVEEAHFHEVGNAEAILNTFVICMGIRTIGADKITATPVQVGSGTVKCAHGELDIPAPATRAILEKGIPVCEERLEGELCTPTSAAIIKHFVDEFTD